MAVSWGVLPSSCARHVGSVKYRKASPGKHGRLPAFLSRYMYLVVPHRYLSTTNSVLLYLVSCKPRSSLQHPALPVMNSRTGNKGGC